MGLPHEYTTIYYYRDFVPACLRSGWCSCQVCCCISSVKMAPTVASGSGAACGEAGAACEAQSLQGGIGANRQRGAASAMVGPKIYGIGPQMVYIIMSNISGRSMHLSSNHIESTSRAVTFEASQVLGVAGVADYAAIWSKDRRVQITVSHDCAQVYLAAPPAYAGRFIAVDRSFAASQKAWKGQ